MLPDDLARAYLRYWLVNLLNARLYQDYSWGVPTQLWRPWFEPTYILKATEGGGISYHWTTGDYFTTDTWLLG